MPYRRSYGRRSRRPMRRRRRRVMRRRPMTAGRVRRIVDAELKVRDLGVGPVDIPTLTGNVTLISNVAQGDLNTQRSGNWIKPVSWMGCFTVTGNVAQALTTSLFRIGLVCWKENQEVNPLTLVKFMQDTSAPHQQYNIENKGQFKIMWSRTGIVSNDINNPQFQKMYRFYVKPTTKILFDGAGQRNNHLFLFGYSQIAAAADPPTYQFDTRIRYTDS